MKIYNSKNNTAWFDVKEKRKKMVLENLLYPWLMGIYVGMLKPHCGPTHLPQRNNDSLTRASELFSSSELGLISGLILAPWKSLDGSYILHLPWLDWEVCWLPTVKVPPQYCLPFVTIPFSEAVRPFSISITYCKVAFFFYLSRHVKQWK